MKFLIAISFLVLNFYINKVNAEIYLGEDLSNSLAKLYDYNPKIKYEREILKAKDELLPRAFLNLDLKSLAIIKKVKLIPTLRVLILPLMELELKPTRA